MPLTPADVRNKQFSTTRLRPGYDEEEVDAFLDELVERCFYFIEEGIDFLFVVARPEPGRAELLVPHIRGRQWHLSSPWSFVPYGRYLMNLPLLRDLPEHVDHQEQQDEAEVQSHITETDRGNVAP